MYRFFWATAVVVGLVVTTALGSRCAAKEAKTEAKSTRRPGVVFVATPHDVVIKMLRLAAVKKSDLVYDLGCGDGRIVVMAAKRYGCRGVGYDIDSERVKESLHNVKKNKVGHLVKIEQKDVFTLDLSGASVITIYLLPSMNVKLIPQLEKLKPGARIVAHDYGIEGVAPEKVVTFTSKEDNVKHTIYLWTTPLKEEEQEEEEDYYEEEEEE